MKIIKKIILILILLIILFFKLFTFSYAAELINFTCNTPAHNGEVIQFADFSSLVDIEYGNYCITQHMGSYYLYIVQGGTTVINPGNGNDFYTVDSNGNIVNLIRHKITKSGFSGSSSVDHVEGNVSAQYYWHCDVYNTDGSLFFDGVINRNLNSYFHIEYNENTCSYFVYTDWFSAYDLSKYAAFYSKDYKNTFNILSYDTEGWDTMPTEIKDINSNEPSDWRQYKEILDYGEYYFTLYNSETKEYSITKIVLSENGDSYISNYNKSSDDFYIIEDINNINFNNYNMYVLYDNYSATIYSNYFKYDDVYNYEIMYSLDGIYYDYEMMIEQKDVENENYGYYRYYKEVTENKKYYFRLRVYDSENNAAIVNTQYFIIDVNEISTEIKENQTIEFYREMNVYKYFKNNFGLLFYPIDIMIEFFDRLSQVQYIEPCIEIPTIREPFTNTVLINEFEFNLNDILEDENISYIYNIYLIFVDCILYFIVFSFIYKAFRTFFSFGGGL